MAKFKITPELTFVDRSGWGASKAHLRKGYKVARKQRTHVIIHHTVMPDNDRTKNIWETESEVFQMMKKLQTVRPDLGLDVPYNFVVFLMNTTPASMYVCEGRGEDRTGAHTHGQNTKGIGISFAGNFHDFDANFADYVPLLSAFLGWLKFNPNHPSYGRSYAPMTNLGSKAPSEGTVFAHKDFAPTACPGKNIIPFLRDVAFANPELGS